MDVFDNLLSLEEQFYQEGYEEGLNQESWDNYLEGKESGMELGFRRFVLLGQMSAICDVIESIGTQSKLLSKNIETIRSFIMKIRGEQEDVEFTDLEKISGKLMNKFRTLMITFNNSSNLAGITKGVTFEDVQNVARLVVGEPQKHAEDPTTSLKHIQEQADSW